MNRAIRIGRWAWLLWAFALPAGGQEARFPGNLDVPFVPTNQATVDAMLRVAGVGPSDYVIDLGSGDGRILVAAAKKYGARGFGVDLDPQRVKESLANSLMDQEDPIYRRRFEGRVKGNVMEGTAQGEANAPRVSQTWRATRN